MRDINFRSSLLASFGVARRRVPNRAGEVLLLFAAGALVAPAQTLTTIAMFTGNGDFLGPLTQGTDGALYGTTLGGGPDLDGTVFRLTLSGTLTTLHSFMYGPDGQGPNGQLAVAPDGTIFGTARYGGTETSLGVGSVFTTSSGGAFTTLYSFGQLPNYADGEYPDYGLIRGSDGNFYGVTPGGGAYGAGTLFRITPGGALTTLYSFTVGASPGGTNPRGVTQGSDGNFYVTSAESIFKITQAGVSDTFYSFGAFNNPNPLVQGPDGNFYGTAAGGSDGIVFRITPRGAFTQLYAFDFTNGSGPGPLTLASDGDIYGETSEGGTYKYGTVFRFSPAGGPLTVLYNFDSDTFAGYTPAGLTQASDGNFYGVTSLNPYPGSVFRLTVPSTAPPAPTISAGGVVPVYSTATTIQQGEWISIYGSNLASATATWTGNFPTSLGGTSVTVDGKPAYLWLVSPGQINLQVPNDASAGTVPVTVTTSGGTAASTVTLGPFAPSFCLLDGKHVTGIILRSDGSGAYGGGTYDILGPTGSSLGYATVAAKPGDTVELFGVGFGPTNPAVLAGQAFSGAAQTTNLVNLSIGGGNVIPTFAGLSGAGLYQINLVVPASLGSGDLSLVATVGGSRTPANVVISLQSAPGLPLLTSVTVPAQITGGQTGQGTITLSGPAPVGGAMVALAAAPQNLASVPATVTVPAGATSATFTISTVAVTSAQEAAIGAAYNNGTASGVFLIVPAATTPSAFTATIQFQPSGSPSCTQLYLISQLGSGYYQINTSASVLSTGGVASNQGLTLTFNSVAPGAAFSCGQTLLLTAFSITLNLAQSPSGGVAASGNLTGSLSVSGSLLGPAVTLSGPISGTYGPL